MKDEKLTFRISREILDNLIEASSYRSESKSSFIRRAVLKELARCGYLSTKQKEVLGVKENGE